MRVNKSEEKSCRQENTFPQKVTYLALHVRPLPPYIASPIRYFKDPQGMNSSLSSKLF